MGAVKLEKENHDVGIGTRKFMKNMNLNHYGMLNYFEYILLHIPDKWFARKKYYWQEIRQPVIKTLENGKLGFNGLCNCADFIDIARMKYYVPYDIRMSDDEIWCPYTLLWIKSESLENDTIKIITLKKSADVYFKFRMHCEAFDDCSEKEIVEFTYRDKSTNELIEIKVINDQPINDIYDIYDVYRKRLGKSVLNIFNIGYLRVTDQI